MEGHSHRTVRPERNYECYGIKRLSLEMGLIGKDELRLYKNLNAIFSKLFICT